MHSHSLPLSASLALVTVLGAGCTETTTISPVTTGGWFNGKVVTFVYDRNFFCAEPPSSGADSRCEAVEDAITQPRTGTIPELYVMVPLFTPLPAASTLQCPTAGTCITHPTTIDLSRIFGAGTADAVLPAHSHIVDDDLGGAFDWWGIEIIGVKDSATWSRIVAARSIDSVRVLQAADPGQAKITTDIGTNSFLFFAVK